MINGKMVQEWIEINYSSIEKYVEQIYEPDKREEAIELLQRITLLGKFDESNLQELENTVHEQPIKKILQSIEHQIRGSKKNVSKIISGDGNILDSENAETNITKEEVIEAMQIENQKLSVLVESLIKQNEMLVVRLANQDERFEKLFKEYKKLLKKKFTDDNNA